MNILRKLSSKHDVSLTLGDEGRLVSRSGQPVYYRGEPIRGQVSIRTPSLTHGRIEIALIAVSGSQTIDKFDVNVGSITLLEPGVVTGAWSAPFELGTSSAVVETYEGKLGYVRYSVQLTIYQKIKDIVRSAGVVMHEMVDSVEEAEVTKDIVLNDVLHMEVRLNSVHLDINKLIYGTVLFKQCSGTVTSLRLELWREEMVETDTYGNNDQMLYYVTVMSGFPTLNVETPFRFFLGGLDITPSRDIDNIFVCVRYYLVVVLYDDADRRYFKNINLTLYRTKDQAAIPPKLYYVRQRAANAFSECLND